MDLATTGIAAERAGAADAAARQLKQMAGEVVGSTFFGTLLKMVRESELKGPYGHGGRGEEVFKAQLHGLYAERLGGAMETSLSDALYRSLERQQRAMARSRVEAGADVARRESAGGAGRTQGRNER